MSNKEEVKLNSASEITCTNCGTNDLERKGATDRINMGIFMIFFVVLLIFLGLFVHDLFIIPGMFLAILLIPGGLITILIGTFTFGKEKVYECNNCGNKFAPKKTFQELDNKRIKQNKDAVIVITIATIIMAFIIYRNL